VCNAGARWVRSEVLQKHRSARLQVLVVWFDMMTGDSRGTTDLRLLSDPRVTNYWDAGRVSGRWFATNVDGYDGIDWDQYFLYGSAASWDSKPGPLLSSGGPVIAQSGQLQSALRPLLSG
jgi:hypothetical protein